jgi:predicted XRE-type DNA-binding protein
MLRPKPTEDGQTRCRIGAGPVRRVVEEKKFMKRDRFASVWDAIENPKDAAILKARAEVAHELVGEIERRALTQARAAGLLGVTQPRISDLMRGRLELFSLDTLVEMAGRIGFTVEIKLSKRRVA